MENANPVLHDRRVLSSYHDVHEVLRNTGAFAPASHEESADFVGDTIITLHSQAHRRRRRLESELFTVDALMAYEQQVLGPVVSRVLSDVIDSSDGPSLRGDLVSISRRMLIQIAAAVIGLDGVSEGEEWTKLAGILDDIIEAVDVEWSTRDHAEVIREGLVVKQTFWEEFVAPALNARRSAAEGRAEGDEGGDHPDLIRLLLEAELDGQLGGMDADFILRECILYLVASVLTTSTVSTHVVAELSQWLQEHPEAGELVHDPAFLSKCVNESLRLHAPAPAILRRATVDFQLPSGLDVREDETVACDVGAANRDPSVFGSDADRFDPWRRPLDGRAAVYGHSFGQGAHLCIGRPLAIGSPRTAGLAVQILLALYEMGVEQDPDNPPVRAASSQDRYQSFPVVFTRATAHSGNA